MTSENTSSSFIGEWGGAVGVGIGLLVLFVVAVGGNAFKGGGLSSSGETMNIESIGGWNVWVWLTFFLLSQSVIVHHLREISKSLRSQQKEQG